MDSLGRLVNLGPLIKRLCEARSEHETSGGVGKEREALLAYTPLHPPSDARFDMQACQRAFAPGQEHAPMIGFPLPAKIVFFLSLRPSPPVYRSCIGTTYISMQEGNASAATFIATRNVLHPD